MVKEFSDILSPVDIKALLPKEVTISPASKNTPDTLLTSASTPEHDPMASLARIAADLKKIKADKDNGVTHDIVFYGNKPGVREARDAIETARNRTPSR